MVATMSRLKACSTAVTPKAVPCLLCDAVLPTFTELDVHLQPQTQELGIRILQEEWTLRKRSKDELSAVRTSVPPVLLILGDQTLDVLSLRFKLAVSEGMEDRFRVCLVKPSLAGLIISLVHYEILLKLRGKSH
jgi:hypothetical protein